MGIVRVKLHYNANSAYIVKTLDTCDEITVAQILKLFNIDINTGILSYRDNEGDFVRLSIKSNDDLKEFASFQKYRIDKNDPLIFKFIQTRRKKVEKPVEKTMSFGFLKLGFGVLFVLSLLLFSLKWVIIGVVTFSVVTFGMKNIKFKSKEPNNKMISN